MLRVALFVSGGGSTACSVIEAAKEGGELHGLIKPVLIVADRECDAVVNCKQAGIADEDVIVKPRYLFLSAADQARSILMECQFRTVNFIGLHGYLSLVHPLILQEYGQNMINQHPGPLPYFGGKGMHGKVVHASVLRYNELTDGELGFTEATVQRVGKGFDEGEVIAISRMAIRKYDTPETVADQLLPREHWLVRFVYSTLTRGIPISVDRTQPLIPEHRLPLVEQAKAEAIAEYGQKKR